MYHKKELQSDESLETESIEGAEQKVWSVSVNEMLGKEDRIQALFVDALHVTVIIFLATSSISLQTFLKDLKCAPHNKDKCTTTMCTLEPPLGMIPGCQGILEMSI